MIDQHYRCLYTAHLVKKKKTWIDGFLHVRDGSFSLYDENGKILQSGVRFSASHLSDGTHVKEFAGLLVTVDAPCEPSELPASLQSGGSIAGAFEGSAPAKHVGAQSAPAPTAAPRSVPMLGRRAAFARKFEPPRPLGASGAAPANATAPTASLPQAGLQGAQGLRSTPPTSTSTVAGAWGVAPAAGVPVRAAPGWGGNSWPAPQHPSQAPVQQWQPPVPPNATQRPAAAGGWGDLGRAGDWPEEVEARQPATGTRGPGWQHSAQRGPNGSVAAPGPNPSAVAATTEGGWQRPIKRQLWLAAGSASRVQSFFDTVAYSHDHRRDYFPLHTQMMTSWPCWDLHPLSPPARHRRRRGHSCTTSRPRRLPATGPQRPRPQPAPTAR